MKIGDLISLNLRSLRNSPLESGLIIFTISLGSAAVSLILFIIYSGFEEIKVFSSSYLAQEIVVTVKNTDFKVFSRSKKFKRIIEISSLNNSKLGLSAIDLDLIGTNISSIQESYLAGNFSLDLPVSSYNKSLRNELELLEVTFNYIYVANLKLISGSWPTKDDFKNAKKVVVLIDWFADKIINSPAVYKISDIKLKNYNSLLGKYISTKDGDRYSIIGVFSSPRFGFGRKNSPTGPRGILPYGIRGMNTLSDQLELKFQPKPGEHETVVEQINFLSRTKYADNLEISFSREKFELEFEKTKNTAIFIAIFSIFILIIACFNITNILLARLSSSVRKIGISKALGASKFIVFQILLIESLIRGVFGGFFGILILLFFLTAFSSLFQWTEIISINIISQFLLFILCMLISILTSVLFGLLPSFMASNIQPSKALRD
jgi:ABC-type antimicrobial peptide transport system permease subunit